MIDRYIVSLLYGTQKREWCLTFSLYYCKYGVDNYILIDNFLLLFLWEERQKEFRFFNMHFSSQKRNIEKNYLLMSFIKISKSA